MNKTVMFIGDCHAHVEQLQATSRMNPRADAYIQLGDMGFGFRNFKLPALIERFKFIRGNHDDPAQCKQHPNYLGEFGFLSDLSIFFLGGAYSIDHEWRKIRNIADPENPVWWEDEELSQEQLDAAFDLYVASKPRIVATHECPQSITLPLLTEPTGEVTRPEKLECTKSRTAIALQSMFEAHKPLYWLFGHYHITKTLTLDDTKFTCLDELHTCEVEIESKISEVL